MGETVIINQCKICFSSKVSGIDGTATHKLLRCGKCGVVFSNTHNPDSTYIANLVDHYEYIDPSESVAMARQDLYHHFLTTIAPPRPGRILDIGCGFGNFLSLAKQIGWECHGVEVSQKLAERGRKLYGIAIENKPFEQTNYPDNFFDAVTLWAVFEEIDGPIALLQEVRRILRPGGVLYIRTANSVFHFYIYKLRRLLSMVGLERVIPKGTSVFHLFTFSNKSLHAAFGRSGLKTVNIVNSLLTAGNPYKTSLSANKMSILKLIVYYTAGFVSALTFRRCLLGPSISAIAQKTGKDNR